MGVFVPRNLILEREDAGAVSESDPPGVQLVVGDELPGTLPEEYSSEVTTEALREGTSAGETRSSLEHGCRAK